MNGRGKTYPQDDVKKVVIVGNGPSRVNAPHDGEVWTMNNHCLLWDWQPTAVFEMHPDALVTDRYSPEYRHWLRQPHTFPIYMHKADPDIPASVTYPRQEIYYGQFVTKGDRKIADFYSTTVPYMLALALHQGYRRVELWGVDLKATARQAHRDCVFFWMGILGAYGVDIYIPEESLLMNDWLYPMLAPPPEKRSLFK